MVLTDGQYITATLDQEYDGYRKFSYGDQKGLSHEYLGLEGVRMGDLRLRHQCQTWSMHRARC